MLEPRARTVDPDLLLESLYRLTDLEIRFPLNLNVLDATRTPGVMSLKEALLAWLDFQIEVLVRRAQPRIGKIDDRLELLDGFLVAFLNLDRVIADHPRRGRAEAGADGRVRAVRPPGRSDPQHAPAQPAQARGDGDRQGARRRSPRSATSSSGCSTARAASAPGSSATWPRSSRRFGDERPHADRGSRARRARSTGRR